MSLVTRLPFQTAMRAAAVQLLTDYGTAAGINLQVYPGRPASIFPPTAFVDRISERITPYTITSHQRTPTVTVVVIHGLFDSKDATAQKDAFVDGFLEYVWDRYHQAGANTLLDAVATEDEPNYIPSWLPPVNGRPNVYYASVIALEGLAPD